MRTVRYGEASIIASVYTERYGMQSYIVNGIRSAGKSGQSKAGLFQPGAILDLVVYHNESKNIQRIKEFRWGYLYETVFSGVLRNAVAMYMIELTQKSIREPEPNENLYAFIEDALVHLDKSGDRVAANFPLYFTLHLMTFLGLQVADAYTGERAVLDLKEGSFTPDRPDHPYFIEGEMSFISSRLLRVMQPEELNTFPLNQEIRKQLLDAYLQFYALHISDFGSMKTLGVIRTLL